MTHDTELSLTQTIRAPQKAVFEAWLDPKALAEFMKPSPGMTVPVAETDPKVGGAYKVVMRAGDTDILHEGEYKEIIPYERLVFTWLSIHTIPGSTVTLTFRAVSDRETEVTLHHKGFPSEESRQGHIEGWTGVLGSQAAYMS